MLKFFLLYYIAIGIVGILLLFLKNLFKNYKAYFSGGNLKVCAHSVKFLTETVNNKYPEGYFLRISTILKQHKNKSPLKKKQISLAIPQISNYADLAILDYFCNFEGDCMTFTLAAEHYRPDVESYLREYGLDSSYITGDHRQETSQFQTEINNLLTTFEYPLVTEEEELKKFSKGNDTNVFSIDELKNICCDQLKFSEIMNSFKKSEEFNNHVNVMSKYIDEGFSKIETYLSDTTDYSVMNLYHYTIVLYYIFLGKNGVLVDNRNKICRNAILTLGALESAIHQNINKEMYYGAIICGMELYFFSANDLNKTEFYQMIEISLNWKNYTAFNLVWWNNHLKVLGTFIDDKSSLESSTGTVLPISDESYSGIKSRYNSVLKGKIERDL